jgi:hypothetical protein
LQLLLALAWFGVLARGHVAWLARTWRPDGVSRFLAYAEAEGLIEVLNCHIGVSARSRDRGGGARAFLMLTASGHRYLRRALGVRANELPGLIDRDTVLSQPRPGRLFNHDQRLAGWVLAYVHHTRRSLDCLRTARVDEGRLWTPARDDRRRRGDPISAADALRLSGARGVHLDPPEGLARRERIEPDAVLRTSGHKTDAPTDVLVEFQMAAHPGLAAKFRRYDDMLAGWSLALARYRELGCRPVVVVVAPEERLDEIVRIADQHLVRAIRHDYAPNLAGYYPGREHILFCRESDMHRGSLRAWTLSRVPAQSTDGRGAVQLTEVTLEEPLP